MEIDTIIWDWNGTLLNDVDLCIALMNEMLQKRNMPLLAKERYQECFTFPVRDYYEAIGWDFGKDRFEEVGHEFIDLYRNRQHEATLFPGIERVLQTLQEKGYQQYILSAMEGDLLKESVRRRGITSYFRGIQGITSHLGEGKKEIARQMIKDGSIHASSTLLIGDTLHDAEIAQTYQIPCLLVAYGHQHYKRLTTSGFPIVTTAEALLETIP
ncbi:MAG: hypothetical protein CSA95_08175 [Bacteroidetes bacterium]|nr:MAG: hypothetical protein CSA95_08175 [Bacteroidota bacterium]